MDPSVRYIAKVKNVREVSLRGVADWAFWRERLQQESLSPARTEDAAEVIIMVGDLRWMGIRFRELSISVVIGGDLRGASEVFMVQAFNSSRVFSWMEKNYFGTPFRHAGPTVDIGPPASFRLESREGTLIEARMRDVGGTPSDDSDQLWEVAAHIPSRPAKRKNMFHGRVEGRVQAYPFAESDTLAVNRSEEFPVFGWLIDSGFRGAEWMVRENATHSRSATRPRSTLPAQNPA